MARGLLIDQNDTVILALEPVKKGERITNGDVTITVNEDIPQAHKVAINDIAVGSQIIKYGCNIGITTALIRKGDWVHSHNLKTCSEDMYEYHYEPNHNNLVVPPEKPIGTFNGYRRKGQYAGIRNYIAIIPLVYCINGPIEKLARVANELMPKNDSFDGFLALPHSCGCSQSGADLQNLAKIMAGIAQNPNMGGVVFVSLGCEVCTPAIVKPYLRDMDEERVRFLVLQETEDEMEAGLKLCKELYNIVSNDNRETLTMDHLAIALNCGGSDGFSGITANPVVGKLTERLVAEGGSVVMSEVPEMFGAEHILMQRAKDEQVYSDLVKMINGYKEYFSRYGVEASGNSTQGNKTGGLTTMEDKSLGCIQKGGRSMVSDVLPYAGRLRRPGFTLLTGPGSDLVSITAQIAAGAVLTVFTTGRGTPGGYAGPLFRLSTNNELAKKKPHWTDFNAGRIVDGEDLESLGQELYKLIMDTVNGQLVTCNEKNGYYQLGFLRDGAIH
ncbi:hypothetical protein DP73_20815 [Desulfosporosinus sp. HMP52]|uniref:UxaA family hydrolase n=1 Tax=Desulfosporosinus sp. HMP52 TaxID=1487923 RepID=UPI00051F96E9|nr:altronate dehydratase family protein [Desulfosporosinus sp. HMP52]KGK82252.1 hypothetical protein DP73_20815 [Desulfosporosinus sp. HMP52]